MFPTPTPLFDGVMESHSPQALSSYALLRLGLAATPPPKYLSPRAFCGAHGSVSCEVDHRAFGGAHESYIHDGVPCYVDHGLLNGPQPRGALASMDDLGRNRDLGPFPAPTLWTGSPDQRPKHVVRKHKGQKAT